MSEEKAFCRTDDLAIGYGKTPLMEHIRLGAEKGSILTLIGPNGAGKSTLLKTLAAQLAPQGGAVLLDEKSLADYSGPERARRMALMVPHTRRTELTTCFEMASAGRYPYTNHFGKLSREDQRIVEDSMARVNALELREQRRDLTFESAAVIDRESTNWTSALTLNRGTAHGVEKNDCVVSAEGDLVGVVSAVGYNWCTVLTVIDTDTELGARVFRTQEVAVAEGDLALMGEGKLKLSYLSADAQLLSGDVVTTSGLGGFYPGGLVIGTVESVRTGDDGLAQYAVLAPAARLGELSEVFIIKDFDIVD